MIEYELIEYKKPYDGEVWYTVGIKSSSWLMPVTRFNTKEEALDHIRYLLDLYEYNKVERKVLGTYKCVD